jgi:hypothetical protein
MGCGWLVEAGENGAKDTEAKDRVNLDCALVGTAETKETNPSLLEGE